LDRLGFPALEALGWDEGWVGALADLSDPALLPARVSRVDRGVCSVMTGTGVVRVVAERGVEVAVGDWVAIGPEPATGDRPRIVAVLPRRCVFRRAADPRGRGQQIVAANIDTLLLCDALDGTLGLRHLERYLALAWQSGATPVVLITKSDGASPAEVAEAVESVKSVAEGVDVVVVSSTTGDGMDGLGPYLVPGRTVALLGLSGAGKSTLVKLLVGLYRPQDGRILYNGHAHDTVDLDGLRERIGFVTQDTQLFSGTIRENLRFVRPDATDAECMAALKEAACDSLLARADRGLDTVIGEGGVKVSGGERQRLSIARALLRRPHLLIFDEATSSLDSITEEEISQTIRDVNRAEDAITILIAHRLSTIMHADRIYVLERGRIVEEGRHETLLDERGLYYAMWRQQVGERRRLDTAKSPVMAGATVPAPRATM
jgi:ABC-type multidrug transport system fused ATPase/permease subunit